MMERTAPCWMFTYAAVITTPQEPFRGPQQRGRRAPPVVEAEQAAGPRPGMGAHRFDPLDRGGAGFHTLEACSADKSAGALLRVGHD